MTRPGRTDPRPSLALLVLLLGACGEESVVSEGEAKVAEGATSTVTEARPTGYVSSALCAECHAPQFEGWRGSHHDLAMQPAEEGTVLGDFSGVTFEYHDRTTRFYREDGRYLVNTEGADGEAHDFEVRYTFGVTPLQQYLIEFPDGRLQCLDIAWNSLANEWFDLNPLEPVPAGDPYHWTGRFQSWNLQCADCHSTAFRKNYDAASDSYASTWEEIDVGCQTCHGPGALHVERARSWGDAEPPEAAEYGLAVQLSREDPAGIINSCAPCHSRRQPLTNAPTPGGDFHDDYRLASLGDGLYHEDGQILEEVYVLGSFMQSRMYSKGVSCSDCHDPHNLKLWVTGDAVCLQCHSEEAPLERFDTLQVKEYASPDHHHHPQDSEGARCVKCHMPTTTYMVVDPRLDHSIRIPRPDLTLSLGTPNACNGCHEDQDAQWAADLITEWYGHEPTPHYGNALAAPRTGGTDEWVALFALPRDGEAPAIARATALELLGSGTPIAFEIALDALADPEALVRARALSDLVGAPPQLLVEVIAASLTDESRLVRIEAARTLAGPAEELLDAEQRKLFEAALAELGAAMDANADTPAPHLNRGVLAARRGLRNDAEAAYRKALELDPDFLPAIFNLVNLISASGRGVEAEVLLRRALVRYPEEGELHYSLGLLLAEASRLVDCTISLEEAARLLPERPRIHYNLGLAYLRTKRPSDAERALLKAAQLAPRDPDFLYGLSTFYLAEERLELALDWGRRLQEVIPEAPGPKELVAEIERRIEGGR